MSYGRAFMFGFLTGIVFQVAGSYIGGGAVLASGMGPLTGNTYVDNGIQVGVAVVVATFLAKKL